MKVAHVAQTNLSPGYHQPIEMARLDAIQEVTTTGIMRGVNRTVWAGELGSVAAATLIGFGSESGATQATGALLATGAISAACILQRRRQREGFETIVERSRPFTKHGVVAELIDGPTMGADVLLHAVVDPDDGSHHHVDANMQAVLACARTAKDWGVRSILMPQTEYARLQATRTDTKSVAEDKMPITLAGYLIDNRIHSNNAIADPPRNELYVGLTPAELEELSRRQASPDVKTTPDQTDALHTIIELLREKAENNPLVQAWDAYEASPELRRRELLAIARWRVERHYMDNSAEKVRIIKSSRAKDAGEDDNNATEAESTPTPIHKEVPLQVGHAPSEPTRITYHVQGRYDRLGCQTTGSAQTEGDASQSHATHLPGLMLRWQSAEHGTIDTEQHMPLQDDELRQLIDRLTRVGYITNRDLRAAETAVYKLLVSEAQHAQDTSQPNSTSTFSEETRLPSPASLVTQRLLMEPMKTPATMHLRWAERFVGGIVATAVCIGIGQLVVNNTLRSAFGDNETRTSTYAEHLEAREDILQMIAHEPGLSGAVALTKIQEAMAYPSQQINHAWKRFTHEPPKNDPVGLVRPTDIPRELGVAPMAGNVPASEAEDGKSRDQWSISAPDSIDVTGFWALGVYDEFSSTTGRWARTTGEGEGKTSVLPSAPGDNLASQGLIRVESTATNVGLGPTHAFDIPILDGTRPVAANIAGQNTRVHMRPDGTYYLTYDGTYYGANNTGKIVFWLKPDDAAPRINAPVANTIKESAQYPGASTYQEADSELRRPIDDAWATRVPRIPVSPDAETQLEAQVSRQSFVYTLDPLTGEGDMIPRIASAIKAGEAVCNTASTGLALDNSSLNVATGFQNGGKGDRNTLSDSEAHMVVVAPEWQVGQRIIDPTPTALKRTATEELSPRMRLVGNANMALMTALAGAFAYRRGRRSIAAAKLRYASREQLSQTVDVLDAILYGNPKRLRDFKPIAPKDKTRPVHRSLIDLYEPRKTARPILKNALQTVQDRRARRQIRRALRTLRYLDILPPHRIRRIMQARPLEATIPADDAEWQPTYMTSGKTTHYIPRTSDRPPEDFQPGYVLRGETADTPTVSRPQDHDDDGWRPNYVRQGNASHSPIRSITHPRVG